MGYGAPLKNQNKGYDAQEKKDLIGDMPITRVASGGTFLSKHMSPLSMSMGKGGRPEMKGDTPAEMHGALHMNKKAPTMMKGGLKAGQVKLDKNKNGKIDGEDFKMM